MLVVGSMIGSGYFVLGYGSAIGFGRLVACYVGAYGHHYGDAAVSYGELRDVS
jgi:hypothetical protein